MIKILVTILAISFFSGCASLNGENKEIARMHYQAQQALAAKEERPLLMIKAKDGESINMQGVEEFAVYAPSSKTNSVTQYKAQYHPGWDLANKAVSVALPLYVSGKMAVDLAEAVGKSAGNNYTNSYNPVDNTNNAVDNTHVPTIVTQPDPTIVDPVIVNPEVVGPIDPVIVGPIDPVIVDPAPAQVVTPEVITLTNGQTVVIDSATGNVLYPLP